jgi:hypothetical protein
VLKEDEAQDPEATTVKEDPPTDESPPDSTTMVAKALVPEPSANTDLVVSVSVETSEPEDNSVPSPPLTRGRKTNKACREKEAASNISLGSQKKMDPYIKGKFSSPSV